MATKGNPRLTFRVPQENLNAYQRAAEVAGVDVTDWARSVLDTAVGGAPKEPVVAPPVRPASTSILRTRPSQLEQEADEIRDSPFSRKAS